ncbi:MAG: hypothetical protein M3309_05420 [Actinomycetota bacterium]|nr:hypothetical protein [Actinomycetota bacterium]
MARQVRVGDAGQKLWLQFGGSRSERGYRNIEVAKEPPRTDKAILAAVTAIG